MKMARMIVSWSVAIALPVFLNARPAAAQRQNNHTPFVDRQRRPVPRTSEHVQYDCHFANRSTLPLWCGSPNGKCPRPSPVLDAPWAQGKRLKVITLYLTVADAEGQIDFLK